MERVYEAVKICVDSILQEINETQTHDSMFKTYEFWVDNAKSIEMRNFIIKTMKQMKISLISIYESDFSIIPESEIYDKQKIVESFLADGYSLRNKDYINFE